MVLPAIVRTVPRRPTTRQVGCSPRSARRVRTRTRWLMLPSPRELRKPFMRHKRERRGTGAFRLKLNKIIQPTTEAGSTTVCLVVYRCLCQVLDGRSGCVCCCDTDGVHFSCFNASPPTHKDRPKLRKKRSFRPIPDDAKSHAAYLSGRSETPDIVCVSVPWSAWARMMGACGDVYAAHK